jgi:hypothetical protein
MYHKVPRRARPSQQLTLPNKQCHPFLLCSYSTQNYNCYTLHDLYIVSEY